MVVVDTATALPDHVVDVAARLFFQRDAIGMFLPAAAGPLAIRRSKTHATKPFSPVLGFITIANRAWAFFRVPLVG